jgi:hypothetical protein
MLLKNQAFYLAASALVLGAAGSASADVSISSDATANMSCANGVCQPTASDAVLNVGDLETLLAAGNVTVMTTGSGVQANNIDVTAKLGWSANALTLDAYQSISVTAPVTVRGASGLSILTNGGGSAGELAFFGKGHVTFKKLSAMLTINGVGYKLVESIATLANAIKNKPSGDYALASDYNAGKDGSYGSSPIATAFAGSFEGLGNTVSHLKIVIPLERSGDLTGLFAQPSGTISDIGVVGAKITIIKFRRQKRIVTPVVGILAGNNGGTIAHSYSTGTISAPGDTEGGGLVGANYGTIVESFSNAAVQVGVNLPLDFSAAGGLAGLNDAGHIDRSYASGAVSTWEFAGGLVGVSVAPIVNSYATGPVSDGASGGLVGYNFADPGTITTCYSTGQVSGSESGGLIGEDQSPSGNLNDTYWDMDTSGVTDPDQGAGSPLNDPGITGLSTAQLQSGLPAGFDPSIWGENAAINNGLPYLLANPPQ